MIKMRTLYAAALLITCFFVNGCGGLQSRHGGDELGGGAEARHNRAVALMGRYEFEEARRIFEDLAVQYPLNADIRVNLAIAILNRQEKGDEVMARDILSEVLAAHPRHLRALFCSGLIELHEGNGGAAEGYFRGVLSIDPSDVDARYYLGQSLMSLGRYGESLDAFRTAMDADPYLGSAYYGAFLALRHLSKEEEARAMMEAFQEVKGSPRARQMEFKYTRMGRRAQVVAIDSRPASRSSKPTGPLFGDAVPLSDAGDIPGRAGAGGHGASRTSMILCDLNGDGTPDLFIAGGRTEGPGNAVWLSGPGGGLSHHPEHPLAMVADVNTALCGDVDNDGTNDLYLCRRGMNQLWVQQPAGSWRLMPGAAAAGGGTFDTVDGALFDADHDGDLDIFLVNSDGPNELLSNNRDGTFRPLAAGSGLAGTVGASRAVVITDLDNDRDSDIIVINEHPPHEVYLNERFWKYSPASGFAAFSSADIVAAVAGDTDADGLPELYTMDSAAAVTRWRRSADGAWKGDLLGRGASPNMAGADRMALADVDGDGTQELLAFGPRGWSVSVMAGDSLKPIDGFNGTEASYSSWAIMASLSGPSILGLPSGSAPVLWPPGSGRYDFVSVMLSGMKDPEASWRSNSSGIGARASFRVGSRWTVMHALRNDSGPGQGLQPMVVGLGGSGAADFVSIDWSDGVYQTEMDLEPGRLHRIAEVQRQLSSCPVLFAWDGSGFRFVSDVLGVGGIGYALSPGNFAEPRPKESFLFPPDLLQPREGRLVIKVTEPMEEVTYLDAVGLTAYDLPPGWSMTIDERMGINPPWPTGEPVYYRTEIVPSQVMNERGEDVTGMLRDSDLIAAPPGPLDRRFIGRLEGDHSLVLTFSPPIEPRAGRPVLMADGWVEYPYSQTNFAAWQAQADYRAPSIDIMTPSAGWQTVLEQFGYPAGMPRQMSVPLPLPSGPVEKMRIRTNQEIYWDRLSVVFAEPCPNADRHELALADASLEQIGFPERTDPGQRRPEYDFDRRRPIWDTRKQEGYYTAFGPVQEMLRGRDGLAVIFGPGESVHLEFSAPAAPLAPGWQRRYVLTLEGWCKDMDLYTRCGETIAPLPWEAEVGLKTLQLPQKHNTRFLFGTP